MPRIIRVLLVDDDMEDALIFRRRSPEHFEVVHVTSNELGLASLSRGGVDLCFADYRLGAESGLDLVRDARLHGVRTPIVVITGQDVEWLGENALLAGATDFLPKDDLCDSTLNRCARWALIRRHVENRREDTNVEERVRQLMGRSPLMVSAVAGTGIELRRVLYLSRATRPFSSNDLVNMSARFSSRNGALQVTGMLVVLEGWFLQVIEGPANAIEHLMERILADPRHAELSVLLDECAAGRLFQEWNMGLLQLQASSDGLETATLVARLRGVLSEMPEGRHGIEQVLRCLPRAGVRQETAAASA